MEDQLVHNHLKIEFFEMKPALCLFGHIHEAYGSHMEDSIGTLFINAAAKNKSGYARNPLFVVNLHLLPEEQDANLVDSQVKSVDTEIPKLEKENVDVLTTMEEKKEEL